MLTWRPNSAQCARARLEKPMALAEDGQQSGHFPLSTCRRWSSYWFRGRRGRHETTATTTTTSATWLSTARHSVHRFVSRASELPFKPAIRVDPYTLGQHLCVSSNGSSCSLIDWLTDWPTDRPTGWLTGRLRYYWEFGFARAAQSRKMWPLSLSWPASRGMRKYQRLPAGAFDMLNIVSALKSRDARHLSGRLQSRRRGASLPEDSRTQQRRRALGIPKHQAKRNPKEERQTFPRQPASHPADHSEDASDWRCSMRANPMPWPLLRSAHGQWSALSDWPLPDYYYNYRCCWW